MQNFQLLKRDSFYSQTFSKRVNFFRIYKFICQTKEKKDSMTKYPIYNPNVQPKEFLEVLPRWNKNFQWRGGWRGVLPILILIQKAVKADDGI